MAELEAGRPRIAPAVLAAITEGAPGRLVRKLDKTPELAESWTWSADGTALTITTDRGETVTLSPKEGAIIEVSEVRCSCLLSPRCLHLLAVVTRLPIDDAISKEPEGDEPAVEPRAEIQLDPDQREAAERAWRVAAQTLHAGASATGAVGQAELLRAVHACRTAGLHRMAAAGLRVVRLVRDLRGDRPEFRLDDLAAGLRELLLCAHRLRSGAPVSPSWIGTARRRYDAQGNLRLFGVFTEAVIARSGYAGVVTYLCDRDRRLFTISDVMPGEPTRVRAAYRGGSFAGASLAHRELCRSSLFVSNATASADGRLGSGARVEAVSGGPSHFGDEAVAALWSVPLHEQLERVGRAGELPVTERPAGWDLIFVEAEVLGLRDRSLVLAASVDDRPLVLDGIAASDHATLGYRNNLRRLAQCAGTRLRLIGRLRTDRPRTFELLAAGASADSDALALPESWQGRVNLGLDALSGSHVPGTEREPEMRPGELVRPSKLVVQPINDGDEVWDPLVALRRRFERMSLGGHATLPSAALSELEREATRLRARMMPTAAELLLRFGEAASAGERTITGEREQSIEPLAMAWLRAAVYERATAAAISRESWN